MGREVRHEIVALHAGGCIAEQTLNPEIAFSTLAPDSSSPARILLGLIQRLRVRDFDILHLHLEASCLFASPLGALLARRPIFVTVYAGRIQVSALRFLILALARPFVHRYIAIFRFTPDDLQEIGIPRERVALVPMGIDLRGAKSIAPEIARISLCAEAGIAADRPILLTVTRLQPDRSALSLIQAMSDVIQRVPEAILFVVGDGSVRAHAEQVIAAQGLRHHVVLLGEKANPWPYYLACDIYLAEAREEVLGVAPLQALACGRPVIGLWDNPRTPEIERRDPGQGAFELALDGPALAKAILRLIESPEDARTLGEEGRRSVMENFNIGAASTATLALYRKSLYAI